MKTRQFFKPTPQKIVFTTAQFLIIFLFVLWYAYIYFPSIPHILCSNSYIEGKQLCVTSMYILPSISELLLPLIAASPFLYLLSCVAVAIYRTLRKPKKK